eukprot:1434419-Prymnesium_polylepis.1
MSAAAMTARASDAPVAEPSALVNRLLEGNFKVMDGWMPRSRAITFFRDVTTLNTLVTVLFGQTATMAPLLPSVVAELGALELLEFGGHLGMLALYTVMHTLAEGLADRGELEEPAAADADAQFRRVCQRDAWRFGSGLDA